MCAHAQLHGYYQNPTAGGTPVEEGLQDFTGGLPLLLLMQLLVDLASAVVAASPAAAAEARRGATTGGAGVAEPPRLARRTIRRRRGGVAAATAVVGRAARARTVGWTPGLCWCATRGGSVTGLMTGARPTWRGRIPR